MSKLLRLPGYAGVGLVLAYRYTLGTLFPASCKYYPSCSRYGVEALKQYGLVRGSILTGWRLLRCNPWSHGGVDHVCDQTIFRSRS
jgi:putative membrane protein insertion efficiency factor